MTRFERRVVVVTGGGSGPGAAVARRLADEGATVVIVGRTRATLDDLVRRMPARAPLVPRVGDVGDEAAIAAVVDGVAQEYGRVDLLVHAAGVAGPGTVDGLDTATWRAVTTSNLDGVLFASRAALPHLRAVGGGIVALVPTGPPSAPAAVAATRAAVVGLVEAMALDHDHEGVRVNAVQYAPVRSDAPPRTGAGPDDVAAVVAFLASDDAASVTGALLRADGGPGPT